MVKEQVKALCPYKNSINLGAQELNDTEKCLLRKGPSFIPNPTDINWLNLKLEFDNFVNKLRYVATKPNDENQKNAVPQLDSSTSGLRNPPPIQKHVVYRIRGHVLLSLKVIVILKRLIVNLKEVLFNN